MKMLLFVLASVSILSAQAAPALKAVNLTNAEYNLVANEIEMSLSDAKVSAVILSKDSVSGENAYCVEFVTSGDLLTFFSNVESKIGSKFDSAMWSCEVPFNKYK